MRMVISGLSSDASDQRSVAGRCLGDIVHKLGDRVLPDIVPILEAGLGADHPDTEREGVCLGLSELINAASKRQIEEYLPTLVPCVQRTLCDPNEDVRDAAAQAFDQLQRKTGSRAVDERHKQRESWSVAEIKSELRRRRVPYTSGQRKRALLGLLRTDDAKRLGQPPRAVPPPPVVEKKKRKKRGARKRARVDEVEAAEAVDEVEIPVEKMNSDIHASAEYRAHLVKVMTKRAVEACS